jgi:hypothetical protein
VLFFCLWQLAQTWAREASIVDTLIFRTYAPPLNGFLIAPAQVKSVPETLRHYAAAMPTFFSDKPQTHPPGLFIFYALFNGLFERLHGFSAWFAHILRLWAIPGRDWVQLPDHLVASAFMTSWVQVILTALAPLSLYALLCQLDGGCWTTRHSDDDDGVVGASQVALWAALALPLIPPLTLFFLQWDANYPTLGFAAWYFAVRGQNRASSNPRLAIRGLVDSFIGGLLLSLLTWLSFGTAVYGVMVALHVVWREVTGRQVNRQGTKGLKGAEGIEENEKAQRISWKRRDGTRSSAGWTAAGLAVMAVGWALPWALAYLVWRMDFFALMRFGMDSHYSLVTARRDYGLWWWMNLADYALWLGPSSLVLGLAGTLWLWRRWRAARFSDLAGLAVVAWFTLLLLNFSGTTRGEVGRLWMFLMPFPVIFSLALPWRGHARLAVTALLAVGSWVLGYAIAGIVA